MKPNCFIMNAHRLSNNRSEEYICWRRKRIHQLNARLIEIKLKQKFRFISKTCTQCKNSVCTHYTFFCVSNMSEMVQYMNMIGYLCRMDSCQNNALFWTASVYNWNGVEGIFYLAGQFCIFYSLNVWYVFCLLRELVFMLYKIVDNVQ